MKHRNSLLKVVCVLIIFCTVLAGCAKEVHKPYQGSSGGASSPVFKDEGDGSTAQSTGGKKRVALTFDDGPHITRTKQIADALAEYGFHATFFVVGNRVDGSEYSGAEAMKYAYSKGNEIAIHAYTHDYYYDRCSDLVYKQELSKTETAIKAQLKNASVRLMRPVGGEITKQRVSASRYSVISWNVDSNDWRYTGHQTEAEQKQNIDIIVENVMSNVKDGAIILMHDIHENTAVAVPTILQRLHDEGYEVVTVSTLLGSSMQAGKMYSERK